MNDKLLAAVNEYGMLKKGDSVLVAVSGGADSMCLLDLLFRMKDFFGITVKAAHVNHCLRGSESDSDEDFVRSYCNEKGIRLFVKRIDINAIAKGSGESTELCARRERYSFFDTLGCDKIATAHTAADRVETMLMNLSRGSGLNGLCSIPPVRGNIIRPLIFFSRDETEHYCEQQCIGYVTDSTNLSDDYTRNKFRHNVVTVLKEINPSFEKNVLRCIDSLRSDNDFLDIYSEEVLKKVKDNDCRIDLSVLSEYHKSVRFRVLAKYIRNNSKSDFEKKHIEIIDSHCKDANFVIELPSGEGIGIHNGKLGFRTKAEKDRMSIFDFRKDDGIRVCTPVGFVNVTVCERVCLGENEAAVDYSKVGDSLQLRGRQSGDCITLIKRHCTKSLKKLFCEEGIPPEMREALPVLSDENGVIWCSVGGIDASRRTDEKTEKFIVIKREDY